MERQDFINKIRSLETRQDLLYLLNEIKADLLGSKSYPFTMKQLVILSNPNNDKLRYNTFYIPKKSGGEREICVPNGNLKWMQLCLNELFKAIYTPSISAMGFAEGRSIVDNALVHTNQHYVFNIDLKDFFPSIDQARVWKRLQLAPFNFNQKVASIIAGLCSMKSIRYSKESPSEKCFVLPQGAPTSPLLTNAICDTLDRRLLGLAKRFGLHYSRYADDITFSSMHNVYKSDSEFRNELQRIIGGQHFTINEKKTRLQHCSMRQEVTGLTIGRKVNVARKYVKDVRAILHIWDKYGVNAAFATFYPRYISEKCQIHRGEPNIENIISGKLCYLKMVKGENDPVYVKLNSLFQKVTNQTAPSKQLNNIDYLFTIAKSDFEQKLGVTIKFNKRKRDQKPYGYFNLGNRYFVVAVSSNLHIESIPANAQISLCRMMMPISSPNHSEENPNVIQNEIKYKYLLHRPQIWKPSQNEFSGAVDNIAVPESVKNTILDIAKAFPDMGFKDEYGIIEAEKNKQRDILTELVESNFDLSILP